MNRQPLEILYSRVKLFIESPVEFNEMASTELSEVKVLLKKTKTVIKGNVKAVKLKKVRIKSSASEQAAMGNNIGLALSGGGVRSAAFSSGVLRRLLQKSIPIDYISCISGGNFTAASFMDWKYRRGKDDDDHSWHHEFFERMRQRAGFVCDWTNPLKGVMDSFIVLLLLMFVNLLIPCLIWGALSIPVAYVVDFIFGAIMRIGFDCTDDVIHINITQNGAKNGTFIPRACATKFDSHHNEAYKTTFVITFFAVAFIFFYLLAKLISKLRNIIRFFQITCGVISAMTVLPWFLQQYSDAAPLWLNVVILTLSVFFWCGFPPLRNISALAIIFYMYAFVIKWRVYGSDFPIQYTEYHFYTAMLIAGAALWASPYLGIFTRTSIYNYVKWRLQFAFYTRESVGRCGCGGIACSDFFPILSSITRCSRCHDNDDTLTLASLADMSPQYISNVVADYWRIRKDEDPKLPPEAMISLSCREIEVITEQPGLSGLPGSEIDAIQCNLLPKHIKLADAMTTAALVTRPPRALDTKFEPFRELQIILGLAVSHTVPTDKGNDYGCSCRLAKILPIVLQSIAGAPIIFLAVLWLSDYTLDFQPREFERIVMIVLVAYILVFAAIAMLPTGSEKAWFGEDIVRWCHVNLYHVRFLREVLNVNNVGPKPPALISLSDLGRVEKYGLLPLFKRRVKKIVAVDGSYIKNDDDYAMEIIHSMELAREHFNCEFIGYDCRDVIGEIYKKYVGKPNEKHPRSYRFIVKYFDKTESGYEEVGQGEVLLLSSRHPEKGVPFPENARDMTWGEYTRDTNIELDPKHWGTGPVLKAAEVDRLTFCCCEWCHSANSAVQWMSRKLCSEFPHHSTVNQLFTPSMFSAYHREGYRACVEADIEGFLSATVNANV